MKSPLTLVLVLISFAAFSQSVGVGTNKPDGSAILEVQSTSQGMLIPRMTTVQRDRIESPAVGLQVFNLDDHCLDMYDGKSWLKYCGSKSSQHSRSVNDTIWTFNGDDVFNATDANVGIGTTSPHESSVLDLSSTSRGFIMPRLSTAQRNAIASPAAGLQIFNLDDSCLDVYDGVSWIKNCGYRTVNPGSIPAEWSQKANVSNVKRWGAVGFSIGTKGYITTGCEHNGALLKDLWEFNGTTWTQKANFTGTARYGAVGLTIGNKGYVGLGVDTQFRNDMYAYNPASNTWSNRPHFPGTPRRHAVGFAINGKVYMGAGENSDYRADFYAYDTLSNSWTGISPIGTPLSGAVAFSSGGLGYVGTGLNEDGYSNQFYKYDPVAATWSSFSFPGLARAAAVGFSMGSVAYVGMGQDSTNNMKDFWKFNPATNTWSKQTDFTGPERTVAVGFAIGNKAYIGTGIQNLNTTLNDFWEWTPPTVNAYQHVLPIENANSVQDANWTRSGNNIYATPSGNVGIGVTTPNEKLEIGGTGRAFFGNGAGAARFGILIDGIEANNASRIEAYNYSPAAGRKLIINTVGHGNVGIDVVNPTQKLHVNGNGLFTGTVTASCGVLSCSDMRYKINVHPIENALANINKLDGITYDWDKVNFPDKGFNDRHQIGVSAQELEAVYPEMVFTDESGYKTVDYSRLAPVLIEAVKELNSKNESLTAQVDEMKSRMAEMQEAFAQLNQSVNSNR